MAISLKKICAAFRENAREACTHPIAFFRKNGMNLAGFGYLSGGLDQAAISGLHPGRELDAAVINSVSSLSNIFFGRTIAGVRVATGLGQIGIFPTLWPLLEKGDPYAYATLGVFTFAQAAGFFGPQLTEKFGDSENPVLRHTLGSPRVLLGFGNLGAHFIARIDPATTSELSGPMDIWFGSDIVAAASKPPVKSTPEKPKPQLAHT